MPKLKLHIFHSSFVPHSPQYSVQKMMTHLFGVVLFPLSNDTTAGPSSEYGGLLLLIPLTPLHTSIIVNFVGPRTPADRDQRGKRKG